jgi:hypothetical protein
MPDRRHPEILHVRLLKAHEGFAVDIIIEEYFTVLPEFERL